MRFSIGFISKWGKDKRFVMVGLIGSGRSARSANGFRAVRVRPWICRRVIWVSGAKETAKLPSRGKFRPGFLAGPVLSMQIGPKTRGNARLKGGIACVGGACP